jgi:hypothetical protein
MEILTPQQVFELPLDVVREYNAQWREAIRTKEHGWVMYVLKYPKANIDNYIIKTFPELAFQFKYADMNTHERLQTRFGVNYERCYDSTTA